MLVDLGRQETGCGHQRCGHIPDLRQEFLSGFCHCGALAGGHFPSLGPGFIFCEMRGWWQEATLCGKL